VRILLIEDNDLLAKSYIRALTRRGHEVTHVASLGTLKTLLNEMGTAVNPHDCIVTDRDLPDGDGWNFCDNLPKHRHIVYMTGNPAGSNRKYYIKAIDDISVLYGLIEKAI
jgi:DNA-binding response OmpR family regulator